MINKIFITLGAAAFMCSSTFSQFETQHLDANAVDALISNGGTFFQDQTDFTPAYEAPAGSGNAPIFNTSFWFAGLDISGQIKASIQEYFDGDDLFPGALTNDGAATAGSPAQQAGIHVVTQEEIDEHIASFGTSGYETPMSFINWPAHGDVAEGFDFSLAPYVDVNGNGVYEPDVAGDYPKIKGDKAIYLIMNDKADIHLSGSDPIGIEVHFMFYQYALEGGALDSTTFLNMRVINRGTQKLFDFRTGIYVDTDLGFYGDDFLGFNEELSLGYAYNGVLFDPGSMGSPGYGDKVPAVGVTLLNQNVRAFGDVGTTGFSAPMLPAEYYGYMGAKFTNGTPFREGGYFSGEESNFIFPGDPTSDEDTWSERSLGNDPGDRRIMMSAEEEELESFEILCFDYAFVYATGGDHLNSVTKLFEATSEVRDFYEAQPDSYCLEGFVGLEEEELNQPVLNVYPNPSNGQFTITSEGEFDFQLIGIDGRVILQENGVQDQLQIDESLASGTYMVNVIQNGAQTTQKLVIH